jgi:LDH2 family malate/lactate/ureidoglycolate dehydrogenase
MRLTAKQLHDAIATLFAGLGASTEQAAATARHMTWCEMVGRHNFGIERIPIHVKRLRAGVLDGRAGIVAETIAPSLMRLDGGGGFGYCAAERGMEQAIAMARGTGIGIVGVRNSNFFGAGAFYVNMAAASGMIGLAMSNSFPKVVAHGGIRPVLGTNPFAFGAPRANGDHLLFDMATAALAGSTVREHIASGKPLPEGLAIDAEGHPVTDPAKVSDGALLPFGGPKGYGLSLLVEILAGVITGAGVGDGVASMYNDFSRPGGNGHFLMALDISRFMPLEMYHARFDGLVAALRASGGGVLLPGEVRWQSYRDSLKEGIAIDPAQWDKIVAMTAEAGAGSPRT